MKQKIVKNNLSNILLYVMVFMSMILLSTTSVYAAQSSVNLGSAGNFVILAKSGISTTGTTSIVGDIGVSPIDSTAITGFGLIADASNVFSTSSLVTGKIYAADYTPPAPTTMTTAVSDMETAYTDAAGRTLPDTTELGAGDISGLTIAPGLHKWGTGVLINGGVTLSGSSTDVWIFQIAQDLTVGNGAIITLSGGAQAKNVFWQVAGQTTLGTTSQFKGIILCQTAIDMQTGATLNGRALAQTAVTLDANAVTQSGTATQNPVSPIIVDEQSTTGSGSDSGSGSSCRPNWDCTDWKECSSSNTQTRSCTDAENCNTNDYKPETSRSCVYESTSIDQVQPIVTTSESTGNVVTPNQNDDGVALGFTPAEINNQGVNQTNQKFSWWERFTAWLSRVF